MKLEHILRIARWEVGRESGFLERDTLFLVFVAIAIVGGVAMTGGLTPPDSGLYTVGVSEDSEYYDAFDQYETLRVVEADEAAFDAGEMDAYVASDGQMYAADTKTGHAAVTELRAAVRAENARLMDDEPDQAAAFPVLVNVSYIPQDTGRLDSVNVEDTAGEPQDDPSPDAGESSPPQTESEPSAPTPTEDSDAEPSDDRATDSESTPAETGVVQSGDDDDGLTGLTPSQLSPPLPFESLLIAFALLVPMNFISQAYASSMVRERTKRQGELLLVSPISRADIVIGKTIPYFVAGLVVLGLIVGVSGGGILGLLGCLPLIVAFLALSFLSSSFARSYKELSFFILGISVLLMSYAFIPAVFTQVSAISSISPLSLVVADLNGVTLSLARMVIATVPLLGVSALIFAFGITTYREEFLFAQQSLPEKGLTMLATVVTRPRSAFLIGAVSIPFVFIVELLTLASLIAVPQLLSIPLLLVIIAFIEEVGKSLGIFAAFHAKTLPKTGRLALFTGFLAGFGFFIAEKVMVIGQQVGLNGLGLGEVMFATASSAPGTTGSTIGLVILVLWPFLHSITTIISAIGARYGTRGYVLGLLGATAVHVAYNFTVVILYA